MVFLAILIHKSQSSPLLHLGLSMRRLSLAESIHSLSLVPVPASLGLCTTLLSDSLPRHLIRQRIALFSSAAPVGAIVTYGLVNLLAGGIEQSLLMWWTGVALGERSGAEEVVGELAGMGASR